MARAESVKAKIATWVKETKSGAIASRKKARADKKVADQAARTARVAARNAARGNKL